MIVTLHTNFDIISGEKRKRKVRKERVVWS